MVQTILVVDDEHDITEVLAEVFDQEGYRVQRADNGRQVLDTIERDPPDVIITDVMMPVIDGVTLTRHLRDRGDQTPVVLMSAAFRDLALPGVRFVPKPFNLDHILRTVASAMVEQ